MKIFDVEILLCFYSLLSFSLYRSKYTFDEKIRDMILTIVSKVQKRKTLSFRNHKDKSRKKERHIEVVLVTIVRIIGIPVYRSIKVVVKNNLGGSPYHSNI